MDCGDKRTFSERELEGRRKYDRICTIAHEFTQDKYDPWDASATGHGHSYNIEIKDKNEPHTKWGSKGHILEKRKYNALMKAYEETGSLPYYLNFFNDGFVWSCDLSELDPDEIKWKTVMCTETTAADEQTGESTYGKNKVPKVVCFVPENKGTYFNYE